MARQPLILEREPHLTAKLGNEGIDPGARSDRLLALVTSGVDRETDHKLVDTVALDELAERRCVRRRVPTTSQGRQRPRSHTWPVGDGDADPPLPEIDAEDRAHGGSEAAVAERTSTRASSVGIVPTQSGQTDTCAAP